MEKMDNIKVAVYCRPLLQRYEETFNSNLAFSQTKVTLQDKGYTFDYIFPPDTTNLDVYNELVNNRLNQIFEGYNLTIFAYGQTGSGKTYTMGTNYLSKPKNENGLIFLSVTRLFEDIKKRQIEYEFSVNVSFLEVVNLTETPVTSVAEVLKVLEEGCRCRSTASTAINAHSSRSHSLFTISVEQTHKLLCETKKSKFQLIDLAGSERVDKSETEGLRLKEGIDINRGLLALGKVISALSDAKSHIPYRDSKLTRLLMDSLGGNSYTLMIACISPSSSNTNETLSTLRYASRARKIRNKPIVNEVQIEKPVKQVAEYEKTEEKIDTVDLLEEQKKKMTKDINNLQLKLDELEMINKNLDKSKSKLQTEVQQLTIQLDSQKTKVSDLKKKHDILDHLLAEEKALSECFAQEKNNAEREAHEKEIQISSLKTDLKKRDDKIHDLGRTNQQLQDELDKFINSQGILEDKVQQLTIQLDSQKTKVSDLEEKQKILDHLLAEEKALSEHFAQEKDNAEQEADENETQILSLKAHLKKRGDKIQDLRRTIQQLRDELDKLINSEGIFENKIHELEEAKHILEGQLEEKRYDIEELEDRLKLSENSKLLSIKVNMQAQAQLERDLQARDKQNEEKEKALIKQIEDLTNKLDSQYRKVSDLEKKHEILDHLLAEEKASSKRIAEENGNAEREIREKEKQILSLQTSLVNREEIIEDLEKTNQQLQNELDDFINREEISKKRIHELEKVKRILEDQLEEQRHQIVELEKSKFVLIRFNMQAQARLERHLQARDDQNAENKKNLIEQVQYVAVELESQRTEVSDLEKRQEILDHPLAEEKASSEHIEQEKDNAEREAHQKEIQILSLKTDLKKRDDKIRDLGRTNHQLQDELDKLINSKGILDDKTRKSPDTSDNESSQRAPIPIDDDTLLIHATQHYGFSLHQPELTLSLEKLSDHVIHSYTTQVIKKNVETTLNQLIEESASPDEVAIIQKENLSQNRKTENGSSEFDLMVEEEEQVVNGGEVPRIPELRTHTLPHACVMKVANKGNEIRNFRRRCRMLKGRAVVEYTLYTPQAVERSYSKSANIATWKKILSKYRFTPHSNYPQLLDFAPENCYCSD